MRGVIIDLKELFNHYENVEDLLDYLWDMLIENGWIELKWNKKRLDFIEDFKIMEFAEDIISNWFYEYKRRQNQKEV